MSALLNVRFLARGPTVFGSQNSFHYFKTTIAKIVCMHTGSVSIYLFNIVGKIIINIINHFQACSFPSLLCVIHHYG